jgi:hypothetical protein
VGRNFLGVPVGRFEKREAALAAAAAPLGAAVAFAAAEFSILPMLSPPVWAALSGAMGGAAAGLITVRRHASSSASGAEISRDLPDLLHSVGTRMAAGRAAEPALLETVEAARASELSLRLRGILFDVIVGRRSLADAVERDGELRAAPRVLPALRLLASTADRDTESAGRVVLHLSEFERQRAEAATALKAKLRSLVETTRVTTTVFAPMILGITAGMYGLLSRIGVAFAPAAEASTAGSAALFAGTVVAYLALEVALSAWLAARLVSDGPLAAFGRAMARDLPTALLLFIASLVGSSALF